MFKQYLSRKMIGLIYWLVAAGCAISFLFAVYNNQTGMAVIWALIFIFSRMTLEVMSVQFHQAETLDKILAVMEGKKSKSNEDDDLPEPKKVPDAWLK